MSTALHRPSGRIYGVESHTHSDSGAVAKGLADWWGLGNNRLTGWGLGSNKVEKPVVSVTESEACAWIPEGGDGV